MIPTCIIMCIAYKLSYLSYHHYNNIIIQNLKFALVYVLPELNWLLKIFTHRSLCCGISHMQNSVSDGFVSVTDA